MSLGIGLLKERKPGLLRVRTLCKVECSTVTLVNLAIGLFRVMLLDILKENSIKVALIVIRLDKIELEKC